MNIVIAGDFCPHDRVEYLLNNQAPIPIDQEIRSIMKSADYSIVNLECPIQPENITPVPILKQGPTLSCSKMVCSWLKDISCKCVTLANNHFNDLGAEGIKATIECLELNNIDHVGGGLSLDEASRSLYIDLLGFKLTIINCCEHEFSVADDFIPGSNPLNPINQFYKIVEAKKKSDFVIVIVHGGVEHFQYPTPRMINTYRFFIDAGADVVLNHHQHCICGYECYKDHPIFYGLGNFCFDMDDKRDSIWNVGYIVNMEIGSDRQLRFETIPYRQCDHTPSVKLLDKGEKEAYQKRIKELSAVIQDSQKLKNEIRRYYNENDYLYRKVLSPYSGRMLNGLYRRNLLPSFMGKERVLALMDFVKCESHYERFLDYIERCYNTYQEN